MQFLYFLEGIRMPGLNELMLTVTTLGEETAFLALALIFFWCVDKRRGYYLMSVGFMGIIANQFMKLWFRIPRPWVLDENFTILEQAREAAAGYSFPSGHTTSAVGTFGAIAVSSGKKAVSAACLVLAVLVGFSRMYVGVHTPQDVLAGALTSLILILFLRKPILAGDVKEMKLLIGVMLTMAVGLLLFVEGYPFPADVDAHNLQSGMKNAYTMIGCLVGVALVYILDCKYIHFETDAVWWAQILKAVLGIVAVLLVKEGLRTPLEAICGDVLIARGIRYCLIVLVAGGAWPMTFRYFAKLGRKG